MHQILCGILVQFFFRDRLQADVSFSSGEFLLKLIVLYTDKQQPSKKQWYAHSKAVLIIVYFTSLSKPFLSYFAFPLPSFKRTIEGIPELLQRKGENADYGWAELPLIRLMSKFSPKHHKHWRF